MEQTLVELILFPVLFDITFVIRVVREFTDIPGILIEEQDALLLI